MPSKARFFYSLVKPLVESFGSAGAIGILMGSSVIASLAIGLWPARGSTKRRTTPTLKSAPESVLSEGRLESIARRAARSEQSGSVEDHAALNPEDRELAMQLAAAMRTEIQRMDSLRDARANEKTPLPGIGEARYHPIVFAEHSRPKAQGWLSYCGGRPTVAPGFVWPVSKEDPGRPLHFLMQWDCRLLAQQDATGLLPRDGVLYCFIDYIENAPFDACIIHAPGLPDGWQEAEAPATLGPFSGGDLLPNITPHIDDWEAYLPSQFTRWTFEPVAIEYPRSEPTASGHGGTDGDWFWNDKCGMSEILLKAQANSVGAVRRDATPSWDPWTRPFPNFPHDWGAVQILAAKALEELQDYRIRRSSDLANLDEASKQQKLMDWRQHAQGLFRSAAQHNPADAVPQSESDAISAWFETIWPALQFSGEGIIQDSVNYSLSINSAALGTIPEALIDRVTRFHGLATETMRDEFQRETAYSDEEYMAKKKRGELRKVRELHAPCPDRMFGPPSYVQGYVEEYVMDHIVLLELSSNYSIGLLLGDGVIQILIKPDDLRERRFDRVTVVSSSY